MASINERGYEAQHTTTCLVQLRRVAVQRLELGLAQLGCIAVEAACEILLLEEEPLQTTMA